jgi:Zn-dependent protease
MLTLILQWFFPVFEGCFLGLLAMALHEAGHLLAATALGLKVKAIGFNRKGLYTVREAGSPAKNLIVTLAGPATNILLFLLWPLVPMFSVANLCFIFANLLPIEGSDGERALKCWRDWRQMTSSKLLVH